MLPLFLVDISPTGPLYIPINTQRNVTCHLEGNKAIFSSYGIILNDGTPMVFVPGQVSTIPGITGRYVNGVTTLLITINTTKTSVTGLSCYSIVNVTLVQSTIDVTIYGEKLCALKAL